MLLGGHFYIAANTTGEAKPKVAMATASANSKLFPAAVKEIAVVLG